MSIVIPAIPGESSIIWNNVVYWPVTNWTVGPGITTGSGDTWLRAAVRFLMGEDSDVNSYHMIAQYAAYSADKSLHSNGYMLIRKLNSSITSGENTAGIKSQGEFYSTLNTNQRQGYVYNGVLTGNFIWLDTPYFVTNLGTFVDNAQVTSKTFYVGTTEVVNGVYQQTSVSSSYITPTSGAVVNDIVLQNSTLNTLLKDTVAANDVTSGIKFHKRDGYQATGTGGTVNDYVVSTGMGTVTHSAGALQTGTPYNYIRYNNGKLELHMNVAFASTSGTRWNGMYYKNQTITFPTGLTFSDIPYVLLQPRCDSSLLLCSIKVLTGSNITINVGSQASTIPAFDIDIYAWGTGA